MREPRRVALSILVVLCGIAIAAGSSLSRVKLPGPYGAVGANDEAITSLLHWSCVPSNTYFNSFGLVVVVCGALVFLGGLIASRVLAGIFSFLTLVVVGLWIGLNVSNEEIIQFVYHPGGERTLSPSMLYSSFRIGAMLVVGGGLVGLIASGFQRRRREL